VGLRAGYVGAAEFWVLLVAMMIGEKFPGCSSCRLEERLLLINQNILISQYLYSSVLSI
jgi:hypothetical protein